MHNIKKTMSNLEDLMAVPGDAKTELIDGEIYMMAPAVARHSDVAGNLAFEIKDYFRNKKKKGPNDIDSWRILPEAWTLYDQHNAFVHDLAAFSRKELPELPDLGPIHVKPKWVCEILSPSNRTNDTQLKKAVLEQHGVPYYWLVDPRRQTIEVFEIQDSTRTYQLKNSVKKEDGSVKLTPFADLDLDLTEIFEF